MKMNKKFAAIIGIGAVVSMSVAAGSGKPEEPHYENLKVLPKNISSKDLQGIMVDDFQDGLGVTCSFKFS